MSLFIKFYFTSSMLIMFRTLVHPSSGAFDFSIVSPHWLCVLVSMCVGVSVWLVGVSSVWQAEASSLQRGLIGTGFCESHKPVPIRPRWRKVAVPVL